LHFVHEPIIGSAHVTPLPFDYDAEMDKEPVRVLKAKDLARVWDIQLVRTPPHPAWRIVKSK